MKIHTMPTKKHGWEKLKKFQVDEETFHVHGYKD